MPEPKVRAAAGGPAEGAQVAAEAAFAQLQALCVDSQAAQAALLTCCEVYRGELAALEEEAASRTGGEGSNGVVTAQNARIAQLKAQVRQQAQTMRDLAAEVELRDGGEHAPSIAERLHRQAKQRVERYRNENERLETELAATKHALAAARAEVAALQRRVADA
ncbi:hypothetical protein EMIHUDRAFT_447543 [Emiliania huxleyi CCMP1516]|uniref:Uncharacterized protein n=2 Tax=Emiliania huxleyi TaxID=2903 RepID=A0A0D3L1W8_EMIH1|nr:hypothetical protein EMIHUDRAFT_447543 [Emiliania huxleyi CCMP1516]EOD42003.1 hypothetical protein EMIHUDRAFT_447543 [Emiliania huxleyi CCMP1516]|mmetsp:Transcript_25532/g.73676  ORF Transcript_25532/g.73676 Transcript_25532/m.73676 type:complete len:164 (-) Transcript_25532:199-690(-)|eukprot:XP_005794432.1 hypothetical protein EMIHUDRAFT_447543 [Emiliania huxleyi CCMP1516]